MAANGMARQQLELLWQSFIIQSRGNGFNGFSFPLQQLSSLGNDGLRELINRYSGLINASAAAHIDGESVYILSATSRSAPAQQQPLPDFTTVDVPSSTPVTGVQTIRSSSLASAKVTQHRAKGKAKVPRPPNAFILYRKDNHPKLKAQYPNMHNNEICNEWQSQSEDVKNHYKSKAEQVKQQHLQNNPGYQYQPRKPAEKKKRMTKTKATYTETFPQRYFGNMRRTAFVDNGIVPDFNISDFGMCNYDMSTFSFDQDLIGAMVDNFNATKSPSPLPASATVHSIKPSELYASERSQEDDISRQLADAAPTMHVGSAELYDTSEKLHAVSSATTDTFDFETYVGIDRLETGRADVLETEVSLFEHDYLNDEHYTPNDLFD